MGFHLREMVAAAAVAAIGIVFPFAAQAACIGAGVVDNIGDCVQANSGSKDCLLAWSVNFDGLGGPPPNPKSVVCVDGDPCDADGHANGVCTFEVGACVNAPFSGCTAASLTTLTVTKPGQKDIDKKSFKDPAAVYTRRTLLSEVGALLPAAGEACTSAGLKVSVPLKRNKGTCGSPSGQSCNNDQDCDDYCVLSYKKGKAVVKVSVDDGGAGKDSDAIKFTCEPANTASTPGTCAEAFQIANASDLIGGPLAMGRVGDWMVRNGQVRTVVRDVGRAHSFMVTYGGHILDADIVRDDPAEDRDHWQGIQTLIHLESTQNTQSVVVLNDGSDCNPAILRSSGPSDLFDVLSPDMAIFSAGNTLSVPLDTVDNDLDLNVTTDYILRRDANYVQVATTIENPGATNLELFVGDFLNAGGSLENFGPGLGFGEAQLRLGGNGSQFRPQTLDYMAWQGARDATGVTYGMVFPRNQIEISLGKFIQGTFNTGVFQQSGVGVWADSQQLLALLNNPPNAKPKGPFVVPAGGTNTLRRWFVIGETVADVTQAREELFGTKLGLIQGTVTAGGTPVAGAHVAFVRSPGNNCNFAGGQNCVNVFSATKTDEFGFYRAYLPEASYNVQFRAAGYPYEGSAPVPANHTVQLKAKKTFTVDGDLPETGRLRVLIKDQTGAAVAAKASVVGFDSAPDPTNIDSIANFIDSIGRYFGYQVEEKDADTHGLARVLFADHSGDTGTQELQPGNYHLVVSRGPEYDVYAQPITITAGSTLTINATVNHVVDTTGFVSMDTHVHMIKSPDSNVSVRRRITTMLAEGVDFFVPTDHDFVHDISGEVAAMGATGLVGTAPSDEITTFSYGHFNVWPLAVNPATITGGALDWGRDGEPAGEGYPSKGSYDLSPSEIFGAFNPATQVIQINHFNSGTLGHFNNLGIDTVVNPPTSTSLVFRCVGGTRGELPCNGKICLGGVNDAQPCTSGGDCPGGACPNQPVGRDCPGGACVDSADNLASFLRMDPSIANLYDDGFTALEIWIEGARSQTELALTSNLADWAGLLNQGRFKTGIGDSDTHRNIREQAGGPRTFVASPTDDPGSIVPTTLAQAVNAGRAIASNGMFVRVELEGDAGATASHALGDSLTVAATGGTGNVNIRVEAPTWAQYDVIEIYMNSAPDCASGFSFMGSVDRVCDVTPDIVLNKGIDFTAGLTTGVSGFGTRQVTTKSVPVAVTEDTWVIVVVRGTDGVSKPLFPVMPQDLAHSTTVNATLAQLTDGGVAPPWNLGEEGAMATAFTNPLFFDFENDGFCHGGAVCP
jgi:hypothetical protein